MNRPILSICIPTFNRDGCLRTCLESITEQFKDHHIFRQVEVVISDNASTDGTFEVVNCFREKYSNIYYFRNEINLGFDRNLLKVIDSGRGEYCLTIGDDDALFPGGIGYIIEKIKSVGVPYFMLNCWGYDNELILPVLSRPNHCLSSDLTFDSLLDFVRSLKRYDDLVGFFGGISTQLFKKDIWDSYKFKDKFLDTQIVHVFVLLSAFRNYRFVFLSKPIIKTRNDNIRWEICPGFETSFKRAMSSLRIAVWINDQYQLKLSKVAVGFYFLYRSFWSSFKMIVKRILSRVGLRRI